MANEAIPYYAGAKQMTVLAGTGGIGGGLFVAPTGPLAVGLGIDGGVPTGIIPGTSGIATLGVGAQDTAAGLSGGVFNHGIVPVTAGATMTAASTERVMTNASGQAIAWTTGNHVAGVLLADVTSGGAAMIQLPS